MSMERRLNVNASTVMTSDPVSLREDDSAAKARTVMIQRSIDHLPVLRQRQIAGVVTSDDIVSGWLRQRASRRNPSRVKSKHRWISESRD
jgi:signal-transduction protein with cAMP-binding, CBS, and nucleotidyltransferase domain